MIRESSIDLAEMIVVGGGSFNPTGLIKGLDGESIGAMPFTDNYRQEIMRTTTDVTTHTPVLEATSTRLAEIIREAMGNIRAYGVPLAQKVVEGTNLLYSKDELQQLTSDLFRVRYTNVEDPFFQSPLYPTEVRDKTLSYEAVDLSSLERLRFDYANDDEILKFINSNHPDLKEILDNQDEGMHQAAEILGDLRSMKTIFQEKDGVFDFSKVKSTRINLLLKMYVLLTKMYSSEDPAPWLKGGDLATYRAYVNLAWNGITMYLLRLKDVVGAYASRKLVLTQVTPVKLSNHPRGDYKDTRFMTGEVNAYYTNAMLDRVEAAGVGFTEVIMGYYWANLTGTGLDLQRVIENPSLGAQQTKSYYAVIHEKLSVQSKDLFVAGGLKAIGSFIMDTPALTERVESLRKGSNDMFATWVRNNFYSALESCHYIIADKDGCSDMIEGDGTNQSNPRLDIILSSALVPKFLRACGANMAAEIIEDTFVEQSDEDNVSDKRQRLHVSLINLIVSKSFDKA